jgi:ribosomal protein L37AE/L43A
VKECMQCGANLIAPARAEHLSDRCVRNVWSCDACGHLFEDLVYLFVRHKLGIKA